MLLVLDYLKIMVACAVSIAIFLSACGDRLKQIREFSEDGTLYKTYFVDKDSTVQGSLKTYYEDGIAVFEEASYVNGELDGQRTLYFSNGRPEIQEYYRLGVLVDTLRVFYPTGQLKRYETYDGGSLVGPIYSYYDHGILKETVTFVDNVENGPFSEYHTNGQLKWQGQYLNGDNEFGELLQYDSMGILVRKLMCDSLSKCRTFWTKENGSQSEK